MILVVSFPSPFPRGDDGRLFSGFSGDHGGRGRLPPPCILMYDESSCLLVTVRAKASPACSAAMGKTFPPSLIF
jgi:hypothetical protein